ncbi:MAG: sulfite dehydrogenase, partial [Lysobacterales bacterium]
MLSRFLQRAPENFLTREQIQDVRTGRRGFLAHALAAAAAGAATAGPVRAQAVLGDPEILNLSPHSKGLGQPVAARGYG